MNGRPAPAAVHLPRNARRQLDTSALDDALTAAARASHPTVVWWWGERVVDGTNGAYCYVCDALVVSWYRARPIPKVAVRAIVEHRDACHAALAPAEPEAGILASLRLAPERTPRT